MTFREQMRSLCQAPGEEHHKLPADADAPYAWSCVRCGHVEEDG